MDKRKKHFAKLRAEEIRRKPPTKAQKRNQIYSFVPMDSKVVEGSKSQAEGSKKRTRKELDEESVKRQKLEDDAKKEKLKACLEIVPDEITRCVRSIQAGKGSKAADIAKWDDVQAIMDADYELAAKLQAKEQEDLTIKERSKLFVELMNERKKHFARLRAEEQRRKRET
ncbi:hypothetical protein Tco_0361333 [Tanacetum coccineum]